MSSKKSITVFLACFGTLTVSAGNITAGAGSYATTVPEGCQPLPEEIYRTPNVRGPMVTGQWWSSLVWQPYSANMFAHPLAMVCSPAGLAVSYPGASIVASRDAIMGGGVTTNGDLLIGHSRMVSFPEARCDDYSDWFVSAQFGQEETSLRTSFGHGSPWVFCIYRGGDPVLRFPHVPEVWSGSASEPVLGITVRGNHYGLFGASGSDWAGLDQTAITNRSRGKSYFAVALLPDKRPETLALFRRHAYNHVVGTQTDYEVQGAKLKTSYRFQLKAWEGGDNGTLFALYPHQWKYTRTALTDLNYNSVRGAMKVGCGAGFETEVPIQGVLPLLPAQGITDRAQVLNYLRAETQKEPPPFADTYWEGKHLGKLATLSGVAEAAGAREPQELLVRELKRRLENWFTASPDESAPLFYYHADWGALIGSKPSYGSDSPLNDHHFHYGYFIRAAAEVARHDLAWAKRWESMVMMLIRDIASPDRGDAMFPQMRCFDKYAGHSWASGDANFADGNNQESSSESLNAWYGMILWGEATGNRKVRDAGLYLFNTERTAVEEYWFDVSGTNFPKDFPNHALGMIWGGKGAFATWFSADIDCIHGINWLPFTPASLYMGRHPDYVQRAHRRMVEQRPGGTDYNTGWGDLVVMFQALGDPAAAVTWLEANPDCKIEGGNTHAFMYHWLHTLNELGLNDASVTADYPISGVFNRDGKKTHAAYNFGSQPLTVQFSDGVQLKVPPRRLATR